MHADVVRPSAASFPLQLLLLISIFFAPCWVIITVSLLIYKGVSLPYPEASLGLEIAGTFLVWGTQYWAVTFGKQGNLTENTGVLARSIVLLLILIAATTYYMYFQVYVLQLDLAISAAFLAIDGLAFIAAIAAVRSIGAANAMPTVLSSQPGAKAKTE